MGIKKNQNPEGNFGATSYTVLPIQSNWPIFEVNGLGWHCCLAGSSKTAPRILIFSIAMGATYLFEVKNIENWAPALFKHNNSFIATVMYILLLYTNEWTRRKISPLRRTKTCFFSTRRMFQLFVYIRKLFERG